MYSVVHFMCHRPAVYTSAEPLRMRLFRCLWSCSLELPGSSRSRFIFVIILFLPPSKNMVYCLAGPMAFFHHSTFVIAFAVRMGEHKLFYLLTYLRDLSQ